MMFTAYELQLILTQSNKQVLFFICLLVEISLNRQRLLTYGLNQPLPKSSLLFQYCFQVSVHILQYLVFFTYKIKLQSWNCCPARIRAKFLQQKGRKKILIYYSRQFTVNKHIITPSYLCWIVQNLTSKLTLKKVIHTF